MKIREYLAKILNVVENTLTYLENEPPKTDVSTRMVHAQTSTELFTRLMAYNKIGTVLWVTQVSPFVGDKANYLIGVVMKNNPPKTITISPEKPSNIVPLSKPNTSGTAELFNDLEEPPTKVVTV